MARSLGVTQKVSSNSKHTLLCLCGHNVLARVNLIPLNLVLIIKKQSKMKKVNWKTIINFLITVLTAVASSFCVQNC